MYNFFAYLSRMKYINRWSLMRNSTNENVLEHSGFVSMLTHALCTISNSIFGNNIDIYKTTSMALFHESSEVITGDLPTPIKYYNPEIKTAYKALEYTANTKLLSMLPNELQPEYTNMINIDTSSFEYRIIKAADKLAALIKCIEEIKSGNKEFVKAKKSLVSELNNYDLDEVRYFIKHFLPSFELCLDELE